MPKFNVLITSDATVHTFVEVEARDSTEAEQKALKKARAHPEEFAWELDEGNTLDPYLCDPGECAVEVESEAV